MELKSDPMLISQSGNHAAFTLRMHTPTTRAIARALIRGGGGCMPDGFLLKSVVFKFISKEISRAEHEYTGCIK